MVCSPPFFMFLLVEGRSGASSLGRFLISRIRVNPAYGRRFSSNPNPMLERGVILTPTSSLSLILYYLKGLLGKRSFPPVLLFPYPVPLVSGEYRKNPYTPPTSSPPTPPFLLFVVNNSWIIRRTFVTFERPCPPWLFLILSNKV